MNRIYIIWSFICILKISSYGQYTPEEIEEFFLYGENHYAEQSYMKALNLYLSVLPYDSVNCNLLYKIGACYFNQAGQRTRSIPYLEKATENIQNKYKSSHYQIKFAPPNAWKLLGEAYHRNNQLELAIHAYQKYLDYLETKNKKEIKIMEHKVKSISYAKKFMNHPVDVTELNLGAEINTRFSDYNPVVSGDENILVYTSFWEDRDLIFMSIKENGIWSKPYDITREIGSIGDCYTTAISYDGTQLFLIKQGNFNSDIYVSISMNGQWQPMSEIEGKINSPDQETSMSINREGTKIYLSSNRSKGYGGFDIYTSEITSDDRWKKPRNLGPTINTIYNEEAPFYSWHTERLYFSSQGHVNMGGMDVLYTDFAEGIPQKPVNLGYPINTTSDNIFLFVVNDNKGAYYSKEDPYGYGKIDILYLMFNQKIGWEENSDIDVDEDLEYTLNTEELFISSRNIDNFEDVIIDDYFIESVDSGLVDLSYTEPLLSNLDSTNNSSNYLEDNQNEITNFNNSDYQIDEPFRFEPASIPTYTIQLLALKKPVKITYFKSFNNIIISYGTDSIYRYTSGEYIGYSKANAMIDSIRTMGYADAFIRDIETISNYKIAND